MSDHQNPPLKSISPTTDRPGAAVQPRHLRAVGASKVVAEGVPSALLPNPSDPTPDQPGIRIHAAPVYRSHYDGARWSKRTDGAPNAAYACHCGQTGTATGQSAVAAMVAEYDAHKTACTGALVPLTEGRDAA
ncbi:hypothetical protein [Streptomyces sp. SP18CS02]|uniref:hypothetical protein n=1 Tax=Streptomyces sp. SP18CS02 TaxID=3002531 RepID=UPI002E791C0E|nr:hypothetical protein [Streptomyces sp. SP18CS02]MEE1754191.1 hypothetical protein [Streptomyces sp. SP18CS02]